ncbi:MAG TPA: four helix bundle protein, partial [Segetibacter sp.]
ILTSQMKRAADSISLNIAEGSTGLSDAEQCKFLGYSQRSALEVVTGLHLGKRRGYINENQFENLYKLLEKEVIKIQAFKNSFKNKI